MKLKWTLVAVAAVLVIPALVYANGAALGISGSPHDFTDNFQDPYGTPTAIDESWNHRNEICRVCHVPHDHNRNSDLWTLGLLWNHDVSAADFSMYAEVPDANFTEFIDAAVAGQPLGISKMCLGCHDGTVGLDSFDNKRGSATVHIGDYDSGFQVPGTLYTGDLRGTHPLSIEYRDDLDPGLNPKGDPIGTSGAINDVLDNDRVECSSCHDVHDSPGEAKPATHLLREFQKASDGAASGLCLACHNK